MPSQPSSAKQLRNTVLYSAICSALTISTTALANQQQENALELDNVIITEQHSSDYQNKNASSPKFTAPLVDTPRTVNIIPEQLIKDRGATSLQDEIGRAHV